MDSHQSSIMPLPSMMKLPSMISSKKYKDLAKGSQMPRKAVQSPQQSREPELPMPSDKDIESFQELLNKSIILAWSDAFRREKKAEEGCVDRETFVRILKNPEGKLFPLNSLDKDAASNICDKIAKRFRPLKIDETGRLEDRWLVDVMEALVALGLLARIGYDEKVQLVFKICDTDNDDCLSFREIYNMYYLVERVFSKECSLFEFSSTMLLYALSDKKAKAKFRWFVKCYRPEKQSEEDVLTEDWLISYEEFSKSLKDNTALYDAFLPPPLDMKQVLLTEKKEKEYDVHDEYLDNFLYFRYEMNWLFRKDDLIKKQKGNVGELKAPAASDGPKKAAKKIEDLVSKIDSGVKQSSDKYRPPGLLPPGKKMKGGEDSKCIESCLPTNGIYVPKCNVKPGEFGYEKKEFDKIDPSRVYLPSDMKEKNKKKSKQNDDDKSQTSKTEQLLNDAINKLADEHKSTNRLEVLKTVEDNDHAFDFPVMKPEELRSFAQKTKKQLSIQ